MDVFSVLNSQTVAPSNQAEVETKSKEEIAEEDAQKQKTDFLLLLLTQLENQNPLDPMDTDEYTAQLTRYSILEQGIETNSKLEVANDYLKTNAGNTTLSYLGEDVETSTNTAPVQDGEARWSYVIDGAADEVTLTVLDEDGNAIHEEDGSTSPGAQSFVLDAAALGLDEGAPVELVIAARDDNGGAIESRATAYATVDGIWTDEINTYLTAGDVSFRANDILRVSEKAAPATAPQT